MKHAGVDVFEELLAQLEWLLPLDDEGLPDLASERADVVRDLLAYLAERMSALHEERQAEVASFLSWLEEQLGCPVDELSGKTYVQAYYEQPEGVEKLLEVIERNHPRNTQLDVSSPKSYRARNPARERVVEGYERSMATLRPILLQLELTDALIDRIVYRLYGLSEEDVAVVEQAVGSTGA